MIDTQETPTPIDRKAYFKALGDQVSTLAKESQEFRRKAEHKITASNLLKGQLKLEDLFNYGCAVVEIMGRRVDIPIEWGGKSALLSFEEVSDEKTRPSYMRVMVFDKDISETGLADIAFERSSTTFEWTASEVQDPSRYSRKGGNQGLKWVKGSNLLDKNGAAMNGLGLSDTVVKIGDVIGQLSAKLASPPPAFPV